MISVWIFATIAIIATLVCAICIGIVMKELCDLALFTLECRKTERTQEPCH